MPSSDQLTLPRGWSPRQTVRRRAATAVGPLLAVLLATYGLRELSGDRPAAAWGVLCFAGMLGAASMVARPRTGRLAPVHDAPRGALRFTFSRHVLIAQTAALVLAAGAGGLLAVAAAQERAWFWTVLCGLLGAGPAGALGYQLLRGLRVGELVLSPAAVRLRVDATDVTVAWDDVLAVFTAEHKDRYGTVTRRDLSLVGSRPGATELEVPVARVDVDEVALYHLLEFYLRCPQARPELAGPGAVARWAARDYPER